MELRAASEKRRLRRVMLWILLAGSITSWIPVLSEGAEPRSRNSLLRLLPVETDLKGWTLDGEPQTAEGIGLFELINGGAEEYVKEGFRRAVLTTYRDPGGKRINLDIYEMLSPESATSIYRKRAGDKGNKVSVGEEASMEDYYLNFRKGAYLVTVSGYDTQPQTQEWLLRIGRLVAERIGASP